MDKTPAYEAKIYCVRKITCHVDVFAASSFRTVSFCFPEDIPFAPESKRLYYFGGQFGASYSY